MISFIPPSQQNKWITSPRCFTHAPSCQGASEQQTRLIYSYKCLVNKHGLLWGRKTLFSVLNEVGLVFAVSGMEFEVSELSEVTAGLWQRRNSIQI